jgi:DNA-binding beta-propeller fold protein YncE
MAVMGGAVFVADSDNGALARVNVQTGDVQSLVVGSEPTRVARIGDTIYVTLRAERGVAVVTVGRDGEMALQGVYSVGAEPYGVVASPDGYSIYVALSVEGVVVQLDADTLEELARLKVDGEPRWLAMTPSGRYLFVGMARGDAVVQLDLKTGETKPVTPPPVERGDEETGELVVLTPRVTGDPVISDDGSILRCRSSMSTRGHPWVLQTPRMTQRSRTSTTRGERRVDTHRAMWRVSRASIPLS